MIFGKSTNTLLEAFPSEAPNELLETFTAALQRLGLHPILGRLWLFNLWDKTYADLAARVHAVLDRYIDEATERVWEKPDGKTGKQYVIVDELVQFQPVPSREEIRNQLLNIFLPARDTAAISLSACLFHLARHPDVWNKLRAEVLSIEGPVTYNVLQSLTYTRAVLNESMLLFPLRETKKLILPLRSPFKDSRLP
jgi:cytochrome P450